MAIETGIEAVTTSRPLAVGDEVVAVFVPAEGQPAITQDTLSIWAGRVLRLPHLADDGSGVNTVHLDQGNGQPTATIPTTETTLALGHDYRRAVRTVGIYSIHCTQTGAELTTPQIASVY